MRHFRWGGGPARRSASLAHCRQRGASLRSPRCGSSVRPSSTSRPPPPATKGPGPSFAALFPDTTTTTATTATNGPLHQRRAGGARLPREKLWDEFVRWRQEQPQQQQPETEEKKPTQQRPQARKTVLALSAAGRSLMPSDFYRVGARGQHVERWSGAISQVIQARDPLTLLATGTYYLVFDSPGAAHSYAEAVDRLHLSSSASGRARGSAADADAAGAFTLVAPAQVVRLEPLEAGGRDGGDAAAALPLEVRRQLQQPWRRAADDAAAARKVGGGGVGAALGGRGAGAAAAAVARHYEARSVLVALDGAMASARGLAEAVVVDGTGEEEPGGREGGGRRVTGPKSWLWRLESCRRLVGGNVVDGEARPGGSTTSAEDGAARAEDGAGKLLSAAVGRRPAVSEDDTWTTRFLLTFADAGDARRFVRLWHRRTLGLPGSRPGDVSTVNAEVLW